MADVFKPPSNKVQVQTETKFLNKIDYVFHNLSFQAICEWGRGRSMETVCLSLMKAKNNHQEDNL